jgi:sigma-B regulation protein RsbU (phosphoserine phosphatase)
VPLSSSPRVLVFADSDTSSERLRGLLGSRGLASTACTYDSPPPNLRHGLLAVLLPDSRAAAAGSARLQSLVDRLRSAAIPTLMWSPSRTGEAIESLEGNLDVLSPEVSLEEVVGRLMTLAHYVPLVRCLDDELQHLQRLGHQLNRYIGELDRDMQLAGRLQRDFMPRGLPSIDGVQFAYVFRPASFVSGDIFDIIPIDEHRIGMFIADAMGHGTAAGLITMFLRKALIPRVGAGANMRVLGPAEALRSMHDGLARHELPNANFVTAAYALVDCRSREVRYARGGHPYPLLIRTDGSIEELAADGGLLGIADLPPDFVELSVRLSPGDKLVFYTDGLEELFIDVRQIGDGLATFTPLMHEWARLSVTDFAAAVETHLDRQAGSLNPADDVTIVALQCGQ